MTAKIHAGSWEISTLDGGGLYLDGGAMFGSVPRVVWEGCIPPDEAHRIPLATRLLLAKNPEEQRLVVIDAGVGDKEEASFRERFDVRLPEGEGPAPLEAAIRNSGHDPAQVTDVIITHLHFDHVGGATRLDASGTSVPVLPEARHWVQKRNWETALQPNVRERASYLRPNVEPLEGTALQLLDGSGQIMPGISVEEVDGHTQGMQTVRIEGGGRVVRYLADLAPTIHHLRAAWTMGYDVNALKVVEEKQQLLEAAVAEEAWLVLEHDPVQPWARIEEEKGRYRAVPIPEEDLNSL
jgi:glyoxylase-like metal-dependent hydrolase (beta-lactamase superfamily II)